MKIVHEARSVSREYTSLPAQIRMKGAAPVKCVVRNFSYAGASLELPQTEALADRFDLEIPLKRTSYQVSLIWRQGDVCGVQFLRKLASKW
jgi:hypothetical protein